MSNLVVLGFKDEAAAGDFMAKLETMENEDILELDDYVEVTVDADGKRHIEHGTSLAVGGALVGTFLGGLVGTLFLVPVAGAAIGAAGGAAIGGLTGEHHGIDEDFVKKISDTLQPGAAAVFLLVKKSVPDKVDAEIRGTEATVISTELSEEAEARLREALK